MSDTTKTQIQTIAEELARKAARKFATFRIESESYYESDYRAILGSISPILTAALEVANKSEQFARHHIPVDEALSNLNSALKQANLPEIV